MSKHTPGPWSAAYIYGAMRHVERNVDRDYFLDEDDQRPINEGELNTPDCRGNPADVAIIAAAPDMLEALERVIQCVKHMDEHPAIEAARDAINKARGDE